MPDDDPDSAARMKRAAEEFGVPLESLELFLSLPEKERVKLLAKYAPPKKRGRSQGSGGDYSAALRRMADLRASTPGLSVTKAAKIVAPEWTASHPRSVSDSRLRHLYGEQRERLEAEARKPRPATPSRMFTAAEIGLAGGKAAAYAAIEEAQAQQRQHLAAILGDASSASARAC
jgi:hypothetical protein